jgi:predicted DNA-binding transcriptional regulator AlpA
VSSKFRKSKDFRSASSGETRLYNRHELLAVVPLTYPAIWLQMQQGKFPLPVELDDKPRSRVAWIADEVDAWIRSRPRRTYNKKTTEAA